MPNDWFQFKQFRIEQGHCAMKVSTDACIQGAWAAAFLKENSRFKTALDIGTGTGLLSLMLLQKSPGLSVTAIEKEAEAARQAIENFASSPWKKSVKLVSSAVQHFVTCPQKNDAIPGFDFIISNPPFFENQLVAATSGRNMARHNSLSALELAGTISLLLNPEGACCIMYPAREWPYWEYCAAAEGLYPFRLLYVHPNTEKAPNRIVGLFSKTEPKPSFSRQELIIYDEPGKYNAACSALLQDYYLNL